MFGSIPIIEPDPRVEAKAAIRVPATILSPTTLWFVGFKVLTPSIVISLVPSPIIWAPIFFNILTMSTISGSLAAFSIIVVPSAKTAANNEFSVAPTDA